MKGKSIRLPFLPGRLLWLPGDIGEAILPGNLFFNGWLTAKHLREGRLLDSFDLGSGVVTDAGVQFLVDDMQGGTTDISNFAYHDSGTGTVAAAVGDTALGTPTGVSRVSGTGSQPSANQVRSVATITYDGSYAVTEWGWFDAATSGTLWDRRVFAAINVVNTDSIEFTYTLTVNSGG